MGVSVVCSTKTSSGGTLSQSVADAVRVSIVAPESRHTRVQFFGMDGFEVANQGVDYVGATVSGFVYGADIAAVNDNITKLGNIVANWQGRAEDALDANYADNSSKKYKYVFATSAVKAIDVPIKFIDSKGSTYWYRRVEFGFTTSREQ